jgi:two-component system, cell cycle sensor histidine kinase and response regulator CckA
MNEMLRTLPVSAGLPRVRPAHTSGPSISTELLCDVEPEDTVFVVDDYPGLSEVAKLVLEADGYRVRGFRDRARALEAFVGAVPKPVLLVTDYLGGTMSGIALIKICKAIQPQLKALLVSGIDHQMLSPREMKLVDGSLDKPYSAAGLIYEVRRLCGRAWSAR